MRTRLELIQFGEEGQAVAPLGTLGQDALLRLCKKESGSVRLHAHVER